MTMNKRSLRDAYEVRLACRENQLDYFPSLELPGYLCVNIVMMDEAFAPDFEEFCRRNSGPCPLLGMAETGRRDCPAFGRDLDLCTDLRSYDVYRYGEKTDTRQEVADLFTSRTRTFLIGSSVSLDGVLVEKGWKPSFGPCIYLTSLQCEPVGRYSGRVAVTMRSYPPEIADQVAAFTAHFPKCHGAPVGRSNPGELGITDENDQLLSWPGSVPAGHDKLYWECGITPSIVARDAKLPLMIVHTPGNALVTDIRTLDLYE